MTLLPAFRRSLVRPLFCGAIALAAVSDFPAQTPTPTPVDVPPTQPAPTTSLRPMPGAERVGVTSGDPLPLTLAEAIERALRNNNDIDTSRKDAQIADINLRGNRGVFDPLLTTENYYEKLTIPTASLIGGAVNGAVTQTRLFGSGGVSGFTPFYGGSYSVLFSSSRTTTSNTNSFLNPQFPSSLVFSYVQPLMRGLRIDNNRRLIEIAKKNINLTDAQLQARAIETIAAVERAYWDLVYSLRNLQVQTDTLRQAREQFESNRRMVERGVLAPIELTAASSQILAFEQAVFTAQDSVTRAENTLKTLLLPDRSAAEWGRPLTPVSPLGIDPPRMALEVALTEAMRSRPELSQLDATAEINRIDQRYYRDQTKPQIDLVGSYTAQGLAGTETPAAINPVTGLSRVPPNLVGGYFTSLGNLVALDYPSYRIGVSISLPWGNRVAKANLARVEVEGEQIARTRAQTEQVIEAEVRNALQTLRSSESRLASATEARRAAEDLYESEQRQFRAGTTTFYLVLQRQTELSAARGREIQAQTDLNKAISEFNRATGATLRANNVTVSK
jgi:outer membrane protein TolC